MDTLSSLRKHAEPITSLVVLVDEITPEGTFAVRGQVHNIDCTYLLRGAPGDSDARIIGCIERRNGLADAYKGGGVIGTEWICSVSGENANTRAFARMVA